MLDYHVHCSFSCDSEVSPKDYLEAAEKLGIDEICFTDHLDLEFDIPNEPHFDTDFLARDIYLDSLRYGGKTRFARGMEVGLMMKHDIPSRSAKIVREASPDFVIASAHIIGEQGDPYSPSFFEGKTRQDAFVEYIRHIYDMIQEFDDFDVIGHLHFPTRGCPYDDRDFRVSDAPELLDALFKELIERGKSIEINTRDFVRSSDPKRRLETYRRFAELGGEYVTIGSDAHTIDRLGYNAREAYGLAKAAGLQYVASFRERKPILHKL